MNTALTLMAAVIAVGAVYVLLPVIADTFRRFRKEKAVVCPETGRPATVRLDAKVAAATSVFGRPKIRMTDCDRWPERRDCGQECLSGITPTL
jgi:hypothetical protein